MILTTSKEIKQGYLKNQLKAVVLIKHLIKQGFTTENNIENSSLLDLNFQGKKIKSLKLNQDKIQIEFKK